MKLSQLKVGDKAVITNIDSSNIYYNRIINMGVKIGEVISVINVSIFGTPILINVCDYNLCIGRTIANYIEVKTLLV